MPVNVSTALMNLHCQLTEDDIWDSNAVRILYAGPDSDNPILHKREAIPLLSVCLSAGIGSVAPVYGTSHFRGICF